MGEETEEEVDSINQKMDIQPSEEEKSQEEEV